MADGAQPLILRRKLGIKQARFLGRSGPDLEPGVVGLGVAFLHYVSPLFLWYSHTTYHTLVMIATRSFSKPFHLLGLTLLRKGRFEAPQQAELGLDDMVVIHAILPIPLEVHITVQLRDLVVIQFQQLL